MWGAGDGRGVSWCAPDVHRSGHTSAAGTDESTRCHIWILYRESETQWQENRLSIDALCFTGMHYNWNINLFLEIHIWLIFLKIKHISIAQLSISSVGILVIQTGSRTRTMLRMYNKLCIMIKHILKMFLGYIFNNFWHCSDKRE